MGAAERFRPTPEPGNRKVNLPLADIPLERHRPPENLKHVAGHELNHALVALALGVSVDSISVIPEGDSLGRTILSGDAPLSSLQIIAMAGSIETHDGTARGFGSDMTKAAIIEQYYNGSPLGFARARAAQEIFKYPLAVREKAAELIAHVGNISGRRLGDIMERARIEVELDHNISLQSFRIEFDSNDPNEEKENNTHEKNIIDDYIQGETVIRKVINGKIIKEQTICRLCGSVNGHADHCTAKKDRVQ